MVEIVMERRKLIKCLSAGFINFAHAREKETESSLSKNIPVPNDPWKIPVELADAIWHSWSTPEQENQIMLKIIIGHKNKSTYKQAIIDYDSKKFIHLKYNTYLKYGEIGKISIRFDINNLEGKLKTEASDLMSFIPKLISNNLPNDGFDASEDPYYMILRITGPKINENYVLNKGMKKLSSEVLNWMDRLYEFCVSTN